MTNPIPTPQKVDELALEYNALDETITRIEAEADEQSAESKAKLKTLVAELKQLVADFGSAHAKKSKLLSGVEWEMMLTPSASVGVIDTAVQKFQAWGKKDRKNRAIVESLFVEEKRWALTPNATLLVQAPTIPAAAKRMFAACLDIKPNQPKLEVRPKKKAKECA